MTKRNTAQQRARELQQAEGIGYHQALSRVRAGTRIEHESDRSVTLTESTLIVIEPASSNRCMACSENIDYGQWQLNLIDVSTYGHYDPVLCVPCAKAIGNAVAHIPSTPAPDPNDPHEIHLPAATAPGQVVGYLSQDRVHLLCRRHVPQAPNDCVPVTGEGLEGLFRPGGGGRRCSVCDLDVLIG
ncbi:hypothetical protein [Streptomyces fuscichromogenes]|uniref:hypothetical protein n=1 Tax=Streptomyces fuscichromogenes TaxID=1324013 RepID=UPI00166FFC64|nr:hypothetical protein [Streptomyces fuscichromogenes]